jgi:hypothetical protein
VTLPARPSLTATPSASGIQFSWPLASGNFQVLTADQATGPWSTLVLPLITNGGTVSVMCSPTNQQQFYRLSGQ